MSCLNGTGSYALHNTRLEVLIGSLCVASIKLPGWFNPGEGTKTEGNHPASNSIRWEVCSHAYLLEADPIRFTGLGCFY